ncbi:hypothetical protein BDA96_05G226400 [Sorghum bicolor]|uniref:Uncharacterized protein n=1 Tax=Sorghum bicolor TaxID=4558 RepID=A0A921UGJ3_SORBI|nr:hypothetical protein BDA96_05G226400 [Sorghum bicolor]
MHPPRDRCMLPELACPGKQFVEQLQRERVVGLSLDHAHASCLANCFTHVRPCFGYTYTVFNQLAS